MIFAGASVFAGQVLISLIVIGAFVSLMLFLLRKQSPYKTTDLPGAQFVVSVSDGNISATLPDGEEKSFRMDDLEELCIHTTDEGPFAPDVWWVLTGRTGKPELWFPTDATGGNEMLAFFQELPGFDNEAFVSSMGSVENANFLCWKREG